MGLLKRKRIQLFELLKSWEHSDNCKRVRVIIERTGVELYEGLLQNVPFVLCNRFVAKSNVRNGLLIVEITDRAYT